MYAYATAGMGSTAQKVASSGSFAVSSISTGAAVGGPIGAAIGAGAAGAYALATFLFGRKGPKQKRSTTEIVSQAEPLLQQNLDLYRSGPRTREAQAEGVAYFDFVWSQVVQGCSDPALGDPGRRCIAERDRGGSAPWCPTGTGCDWFSLYRDPIAGDVPADSRALANVFDVGQVPDGSPGLVLLGAGLLLAGMVMN